MKVITLKKFKDLKKKCVRNIGDEFDITKSRFAEITGKIPGAIEEKTDPGEQVEELTEEKTEEVKMEEADVKTAEK